MSEPRFFVPPDAIRGKQVIFPPEQSVQIQRVLRLTPGHVVYVLDNQGHIYTVRLDLVTRQEVRGHIVDVREADGEPPIHITLYIALLKGEKMDWVLQKGTEIGVRRFVPVLTERTIVRRREVRARWARILQEAAEQCRRAYIPTLAPVLSWREALESSDAPARFIAHNSEDVPLLRALVPQVFPPPARVDLFVGPEGGFTDDEVAQAQAAGIVAVHLGPRVLRAETAAIVLPALVLHHWGDVG